ncbi:hypothetical protein ACYSNX_06530 [Myroides sp. LJL115]
MKFQKIITYIVLTILVYGIFNFDTTDMWSLQANWLSFIGFFIFIVYLGISLKIAAKKQDLEKKNTSK